MKPFTVYEKLSKKDKRAVDAAKRRSWGELKPITRKPDNPRVYNRKRQRWSDDGVGVFLCAE